MTNQDEIVRRLVLQAVAWDQKKDPLPQWFEEVSPLDPYKFISREDQLRKTKAEVPKGPSYQKQADNLMGDLLRICDISNHEHSAAKEDAPKISKSHVVSASATFFGSWMAVLVECVWYVKIFPQDSLKILSRFSQDCERDPTFSYASCCNHQSPFNKAGYTSLGAPKHLLREGVSDLWTDGRTLL